MRSLTRRKLFLFLFLFLASASLVRPFAAGSGPGQETAPVFEGIWNSATATPLERPAALKEKAFFTPEEAMAWEREVAERNLEPSGEAAAKSTGTGTYNTF